MKYQFIASLLLIGSIATYAVTKKEHRTLLITGCARSGTTYIAKVLQQSGLEIGHEKMQRDGVAAWQFAANPVGVKRGVNLNKTEFDHTFHQVRHPLKVISSVFVTENRHSWNYILKQVPEIKIQDSHLVKCAKYWYYWNLKAEQKAEWTYRIEDLDKIWDTFQERLGEKIAKNALALVPKNSNTAGSKVKEFTWEDLKRELPSDLFEKIQALAQKYGYTL